ncbi:MarR family winged helix-turn-helix transcriptional regulator [Rhodobium gokarnense]|uniref:DNA-binding MarR family transcriptional regulator n=1 Tax=Rhodobium gokarnense TaxID=364296 RepID=A0ABT3HCX4_9HYPH|nr:MarR family transcriptional regulator [Rhodobium gokarnense]MCW2308241.1 DNA-binding MarR family transcriptional regulator [Rhodobium gokarnense]
MTEDILRTLGHLALGSRMKRLGEMLQAQTQALVAGTGADLPAAQYPLLEALERLGPTKIGVLAAVLGVAQPGVTRMVDKLEAAGWVETQRDDDDRRVRTVRLTATANRMLEKARKDVWPTIEAAVADACATGEGPLLDRLTALEDALKEAPLTRRAAALREGGDDGRS